MSETLDTEVKQSADVDGVGGGGVGKQSLLLDPR